MKSLKQNRALFLTAIASGTMLNPLNSSMISLALHSIQKDFHLSFSTVSWLISAFYLASAVAQPVTGKIGDLVGRKKVFLIGLLLVAVSAFGAPLAPSFFFLVVMRLFQSVGSSAIYPSGVALIRNHIHENQASALAVLSIFASAMTALGPTVGGLLIGIGNWPTIFTVNFPFIVISFLLGWYMIPKDEKKKDSDLKSILHLDWFGILLFSIGLVFLLWFLLSLDTAFHIVAGMIGIVFLVIFVWHELKAKTPFIDIHFLNQNRPLTMVYIQFIVLNLFNYCLFFGLPSFFQDSMHLSVHASGLMMLFMSGASILVSLLTGKWVDKVGAVKPIKIGTFTMILGAILLTLFFVHVPIWAMGIILFVLGIGYGIGNVALQVAMLDTTPEKMVGTSSGLFQTCRYLGSILSSVVLGMVFGKAITPSHFVTLGIILIVTSIISMLMSMRFSKLTSATHLA
ncbi:MFS transporter [Heyndrickxia ginsengihumi]|uniref:MFS transporter n=1 Tax=Heyndrickxia ginsengihumi TaxID=363870 RepID=A0A0A6VET2_9BACI|nr:MFS transporter [Heyndrickxia ginsengihumi]KHD85059.1 MFS transporter [Heyndrickxia ginsengihumi]MBE6184457.1 MFS transporter [Bacillus sp. (in: firmicutes)]MCM3024123.1 MFS transporter [Heyndrickxia ginsengihumi]NEY21036.1 MFS transporter [Heyndrickxia ginsengihumi]